MMKLKAALAYYFAGLHLYDPIGSAWAFLQLILLNFSLLAYVGCLYYSFYQSNAYLSYTYLSQKIVELMFSLGIKMVYVVLAALSIFPVILFSVHLCSLKKRKNGFEYTRCDKILYRLFSIFIAIHEFVCPLMGIEILQCWRSARYDLANVLKGPDGLYDLFPYTIPLNKMGSLDYYLWAITMTFVYASSKIVLLIYSYFRIHIDSKTGFAFQTGTSHLIRNLVITYLEISYLIYPNVNQ